MYPPRIWIILSLVASLFVEGYASAPGPDVLFINSYHPGLGWSDAVLAGVRDGMGPHEQLAVEYLDSKRFESPHVDSVFARLFEYKYRHNLPKVIVASDDYALQFLFTWRDSLFPGIPVVFCGINTYQAAMIAGRKGYTGVSQWNHMFETADLITRLLPETHDVWVVTESSATGTGNRRRLDSLARTKGDGLDFHFLDSAGTPSWGDIRRVVLSLQPGSVVYWSELFRDRDGLYIDPDEDVAALVRESPVPFFTHQASYLSAGMVGGDCNHGMRHGLQAGRIVRRILSGEDPDRIPVQEDGSVFPTFRHDAMERFGIPADRLPPGSTILGAPVPIWKAYPVQTMAAAIAILLLVSMALGLSEALRRVRRSRRKLAESEAVLRASEAGLRDLFDALSDAVTVFGVDGRIEFMNKAGFRLYELRGVDLPRISAVDLCAPESLAEIQRRDLWKRVVEGLTDVREFRARKPFPGVEFDAEYSMAPLPTEGRTCIVTVVRDVTERVEARHFLERSKDELERKVQERTADLTHANKELETFAYSVSHDLRTPLRGINGFAQALTEDIGATLDPEHLDYLDRIRAASAHMGEIIDSLLHLSRITTKSLERTTISMAQVVASICGPQIENHPEIEWVIGDLPDVIADYALIAPLWTNLIDNAIKYSSRKDSPRIEIGSFVQDFDRVWFVRDNGAGFDMAHSNHLFEPFRRMHTTEEFPGNGIGLATVRRVVQRHGGRIWAQGDVDKGATFYFTLG